MASQAPLFSFEEWVIYVFDNPPGRSWDAPDDAGDLPPATLIDYLTRLFEDGATLLAPYSDGQVAEALWSLMGLGGDAAEALLDPTVPWEARRRCLEATTVLFDSICYMWWDLSPTWGAPRDPGQGQLDAAVLSVLERQLALEPDPCRESALHGFGHWALHYSGECAAIVDRFLTGSHDLRPELERCARSAQGGCVP